MAGPVSRRVWAVTLAAWVGGVVGSFVAPSMISLGLSVGSSSPLLGGAAAIYVAFVLGALVGAAGGSCVAYVASRQGHATFAAFLGAAIGIALAGVAGYFSERVADWWASTFFQAPLSAGLFGGVLAGIAAGIAGALVLRPLRPPGPPRPKERRFATLVGSLLGLFAGYGGGSLGGYLALAHCPFANGGGSGPVLFTGCDFTQGAAALGAWAGAAAAALAAFATATILSGAASRAARDRPNGPIG